MLEQIATTLKTLRNTKPLVLNLTNYVTMDFMANSLLAIGAAPIMTVANAELDELIQIANCIHINIGTLDKEFIERCELAVKFANKHRKPIVLDPVGAGASQLRTRTAIYLLPHASIVRGNASEIMALAKVSNKTLGVETTNTIQEAKQSALNLARTHGATIVVSGEVDFITDGTKQIEVPYGSNLMSLVTGMGCTMTAVIAAFRSVINDNFAASTLATQYYGLCGQLTARNTQHPGTFRTQFIDNLHAADFIKLGKIYAK